MAMFTSTAIYTLVVHSFFFQEYRKVVVCLKSLSNEEDVISCCQTTRFASMQELQSMNIVPRLKLADA